MDKARKILNELMGPNRNNLKTHTWNENERKDVCIYMLAGLCPYQLITTNSLKNFKSSKCNYKIHDNYYKRIHSEAGRPNIILYERMLLSKLISIYFSIYNKKIKIFKNLHFMENVYLKAKFYEFIENVEFEDYEKLESKYEMFLCESGQFYEKINQCNICWKVFDGIQPANYLEMHYCSKFHCVCVDIYDKMIELWLKYE